MTISFDQQGRRFRSALWIIAVIAVIAMIESAALANPPTAEDLYAEGQTAYDHGDFPTAIQRWRASYQLSGESGLLFNLAQAERLSGDCAGSLATYRKFVASDPDPASEQHRLAEDFTRELAPKCGAPATPHVDPQPQPSLGSGLNLVDRLSAHEDRSDPPGRSIRLAGLVTGSAGVVTIVTGLAIGHHAQTLAGDVTDACRTDCDWSAQAGKDAAGRRDATIGRVLDVAGAVGIAGGAVMYYLGVRGSGVLVAPTSDERGAAISWSGSW